MSPEPTRAGTRSRTLRQAASAIFAVTTIVPLMTLVWTLHRLGALSELQSQVGLTLALAVGLLGFYIFRQLMGRMSDLIQALGAVVERGARPVAAARPPLGAPAPGPSPAPASPVGAAAPERPGPPDSAQLRRSPAPLASPSASDAAAVPGLGPVREVRDLGRAIALLWQVEAATYRGRHVVVSVMNAALPIPGRLVEVTDDGLLLEVEGSERVAVSYKRISAIDSE